MRYLFILTILGSCSTATRSPATQPPDVSMEVFVLEKRMDKAEQKIQELISYIEVLEKMRKLDENMKTLEQFGVKSGN